MKRRPQWLTALQAQLGRILAARQQPGAETGAQRPPTRQAQVLRLGLVALALLAAGAVGFIATRQATLFWSEGLLFAGPIIQPGASTPAVNAQGTPLATAPSQTLPEIAPSLNPWDGAGRVTVLLLGLDYRDWEAQAEASRSDTMILLTLDPQTNTAGILSIPRDLWVAIPGFKHGKINTAYYLGDAYKLPGGGPALAVKTVEQLLGVPINYYAQIDFSAFVRFIDEIGGVKVDVPQDITIDLLGSGFKTKKKLKAGVQVLPGEWALAYARARYTEGGDFDRAFRQQQVILGIRDRILSTDQLPELIQKAPTLYNELASGIRTNLTLDDLIKLALAAQRVPEQNIQRGIIDKDNVYFGFSPDGLSILIPIPDDIFLLRDRIFASTGALGPATPGDRAQRMAAEGARIALYNGGVSAEVFDRTVNYLRGLGANLVQTAAANQAYPATVIIDHTGNPFTLQFLVDLIKIPANRIIVQYDPNAAVDVEVFLGSEWAASALP